MINKTYDLTASHIKYLIALEKLSKDKNGVRCVDIANELSVTKPSVHAMIRTLCKMNLVKYERYGVIFLKEEGRELAKKYSIYANTLKSFLEEIFAFGEDIDNAVFAFLSEISPQSIDTLEEFDIRALHKKVS